MIINHKTHTRFLHFIDEANRLTSLLAMEADRREAQINVLNGRLDAQIEEDHKLGAAVTRQKIEELQFQRGHLLNLFYFLTGSADRVHWQVSTFPTF